MTPTDIVLTLEADFVWKIQGNMLLYDSVLLHVCVNTDHCNVQTQRGAKKAGLIKSYRVVRIVSW